MSKEKLVRDKMPELCEATPNWTKMNYRVVSTQEELNLFLLRKLIEEAIEVAVSCTRAEFIEEMADLQEVISSIQEINNISDEKLREVRLKKLEERGGFKNGIIWNGEK